MKALPLRPLSNWTSPSMKDHWLTCTTRKPPLWMLKPTKTPFAKSFAPSLTLMLPSTFVPLRLHVAPWGTMMLSVVATMVPRHTRSSTNVAGSDTVSVENKTLASNNDFFGHTQRLCGLRFERWEP